MLYNFVTELLYFHAIYFSRKTPCKIRISAHLIFTYQKIQYLKFLSSNLWYRTLLKFDFVLKFLSLCLQFLLFLLSCVICLGVLLLSVFCLCQGYWGFREGISGNFMALFTCFRILVIQSFHLISGCLVRSTVQSDFLIYSFFMYPFLSLSIFYLISVFMGYVHRCVQFIHNFLRKQRNFLKTQFFVTEEIR